MLPLWLTIVFHYFQHEQLLTPTVRWLLLVEPVLQIVLLLTDNAHDLLWGDLRVDPEHEMMVIVFTRYVGNALHILYTYFIFIFGSILLFRVSVRGMPAAMHRVGYVIAVSLIPWVTAGFLFFRPLRFSRMLFLNFRWWLSRNVTIFINVC